VTNVEEPDPIIRTVNIMIMQNNFHSLHFILYNFYILVSLELVVASPFKL